MAGYIRPVGNNDENSRSTNKTSPYFHDLTAQSLICDHFSVLFCFSVQKLKFLLAVFDFPVLGCFSLACVKAGNQHKPRNHPAWNQAFKRPFLRSQAVWTPSGRKQIIFKIILIHQ